MRSHENDEPVMIKLILYVLILCLVILLVVLSIYQAWDCIGFIRDEFPVKKKRFNKKLEENDE